MITTYRRGEKQRTNRPILHSFLLQNGPKQHHLDENCTAFKTASAAKVSMHLSVKHSLKAHKTKINLRTLLLKLKTDQQTMSPKRLKQPKEKSKLLEKCFFKHVKRHARKIWASHLVRYCLLYLSQTSKRNKAIMKEKNSVWKSNANSKPTFKLCGEKMMLTLI